MPPAVTKAVVAAAARVLTAASPAAVGAVILVAKVFLPVPAAAPRVRKAASPVQAAACPMGPPVAGRVQRAVAERVAPVQMQAQGCHRLGVPLAAAGKVAVAKVRRQAAAMRAVPAAVQ